MAPYNPLPSYSSNSSRRPSPFSALEQSCWLRVRPPTTLERRGRDLWKSERASAIFGGPRKDGEDGVGRGRSLFLEAARRRRLLGTMPW